MVECSSSASWGTEELAMLVRERVRILADWVVARVGIKSERGATAVEYGIMVALIAAVIIIAVLFLGRQTSRTFSCTAGSIQDTANAC
jgi:pilus assembly protein Flp/PilA